MLGLGVLEEIAAWINDENHLREPLSCLETRLRRLIVRGGDLRAAVDLLEEANEALESGLKMKGHSFARSDRGALRALEPKRSEAWAS